MPDIVLLSLSIVGALASIGGCWCVYNIGDNLILESFSAIAIIVAILYIGVAVGNLQILIH